MEKRCSVGLVAGGITPSLNSFYLNDHHPYQVAEYHLRAHICKGLRKVVADLLFASILYNLNTFHSQMHEEPTGKCKNNSHPFIICLDETFRKRNVSTDMMNFWNN